MVLLAAGLFVIGCMQDVPDGFLGSGLVEARSYQIAAASSGRLVWLAAREGDSVRAGQLIAVVDTTHLALRLKETEALSRELGAGRSGQKSQTRAMEEEIVGLERELQRIAPLTESGALPAQQKDQLQTQLQSARSRLQSARQNQSGTDAKVEAFEARIEQILAQVKENYIVAPRGGRLLTQFKSLGEMVMPGQPIFELAREDTLQVDFFVPQYLLGSLRYGQEVRLRVDMGKAEDEAVLLPAVISWTSNEAEFSPKNIQTRQSRQELVFRVRALAGNERGLLKRGLPVEVWVAAESEKGPSP